MTLLPDAGVSARQQGLTLAEVLDAGFPVCYVIEADALWADRAIKTVLDSRMRLAGVGEFERTVARWTRAGGWKGVSGYGFALAGEADGSSTGGVRDQVARLSASLANGSQPGRGPHPLDAAIFSLRGLQHELAEAVTAEILTDAAHGLVDRGATLLIELDSHPVASPAWTVAAALGPVVLIPDDPSVRYAEAAKAVFDAAGATGDREIGLSEIAAVFEGLTVIQANAVARLVSRVVDASHSARSMPALVAECRARVLLSFAAER